MENKNPISPLIENADVRMLYDFVVLVKQIEKKFSISFEDEGNSDLFIQLCKPVISYINNEFDLHDEEEELT